MRMSVLFGAKNFGFFEIYAVSVRTRGLSQCGQWRGGNFSRFCADVFYGRPFTQTYTVFKCPCEINQGGGNRALKLMRQYDTLLLSYLQVLYPISQF